MTPKQLRQLWFTVGAVLFYFSFNFLAWSQAWNISLPGLNFNTKDPKMISDVALYYGLLACAPILLVELLITQQYTKRTQTVLWAERIPTFFDPEPDFSSSDTKTLQMVLYAGVLLFAEIAQIHFFERFSNNKISTKYLGQTISPGFSKFTYFVPPWKAFNGEYKFAGCAYAPFWEPWALAVAELVLFWLFLRISLNIFKPVKKAVQRKLVFNSLAHLPEGSASPRWYSRIRFFNLKSHASRREDQTRTTGDQPPLA